jgi:hypothetical protein
MDCIYDVEMFKYGAKVEVKSQQAEMATSAEFEGLPPARQRGPVRRVGSRNSFPSAWQMRSRIVRCFRV